jgi:hypothetical protein
MKMSTNMKVEDRLDGGDNFIFLTKKILLIIEYNELLDHIKQMLLETK